MILNVDLSGNVDPAALFELFVVVVLAGHTHKLDILHAAGHGEAAGHERALAGLRGLADLGQIFYRLAVVFLRVIHAVHVPDAEEFLGDFDDRGVNIKGQRVGDVVVGNAAVLELVGDIAAAAGLAYQFVDKLAALVVVDGLGTVDDQQFTAANLIQQQAAHGAVARVGLDGRAVGSRKALVDEPVVRHGVVQFLHEPHTIVLDDDAAAAGFLFQGGQVLLGQLALVLDLGNVYAAESELGGVILDLTFLADQQQGLVAGVEVGILHRFLDEFRLAAFQLADKEVDRDLFRHRGVLSGEIFVGEGFIPPEPCATTAAFHRSRVVGAAYMRPARVRQTVVCGKAAGGIYAAPTQHKGKRSFAGRLRAGHARPLP